MKKILFTVICVFSFFSLNRADINDVTFVKAIGITKENDYYKIIFNTILPEKGMDTSTYEIQSIVIEGKTISEIFDSFLDNHYQQISFHQLELLLIDTNCYISFQDYIIPLTKQLPNLNFYVGVWKENNLINFLYNRDSSTEIVKKLKKKHYTMKNILVSYLDDNYLYIPSIEGGFIYET